MQGIRRTTFVTELHALTRYNVHNIIHVSYYISAQIL